MQHHSILKSPDLCAFVKELNPSINIASAELQNSINRYNKNPSMITGITEKEHTAVNKTAVIVKLPCHIQVAPPPSFQYHQ
jgi:hypothetical protein